MHRTKRSEHFNDECIFSNYFLDAKFDVCVENSNEHFTLSSFSVNLS